IFLQEQKNIDEAAKSEEIRNALPVDLFDDLRAAATAFNELLKPGGKHEYDALIGALVGLLSASLDRIDQSMVATARQVKLERLITLIVTVQGKLDVPPSGPGDTLRPLWDGAGALKQLQLALEQRVQEHTLLQDLDTKLRAVCEGGGPSSAIAEWPRI